MKDLVVQGIPNDDASRRSPDGQSGPFADDRDVPAWNKGQETLSSRRRLLSIFSGSSLVPDR
jgi:hypothetical protein